jgi:hypothetical protein
MARPTRMSSSRISSLLSSCHSWSRISIGILNPAHTPYVSSRTGLFDRRLTRLSVSIAIENGHFKTMQVDSELIFLKAITIKINPLIDTEPEQQVQLLPECAGGRASYGIFRPYLSFQWLLPKQCIRCFSATDQCIALCWFGLAGIPRIDQILGRCKVLVESLGFRDHCVYLRRVCASGRTTFIP